MFGPGKKKKKIELATRTSNALIFAHNARNTGGIGNQSRRSMSKSPVPLNAALHPLIPASLPARSFRSVVCSPHTALPHTSSGPLLTNSQPLLPHFPRGPLPSLPFPPSHITAHSIPDSAVSRRNPARPPAGFQAARPPARPSLEPARSPARVPGAPRSLPRLFPEAPRLPAPRPLAPHGSAPERGSTTAREPLPSKDEADPSAPHPRPITGPAAAASPVTVSAAPAAASARVQGGEPGACWSPGPSRGSRGCRVCGPAGRQAAGGGRLCTRAPRAAQPRTAPAPANNRLRLQRSASYRRRRVVAGPRGSLGNGVSTRPTPSGMPGVGGGQCRKALARPGTSLGPLGTDIRAAAAFASARLPALGYTSARTKGILL